MSSSKELAEESNELISTFPMERNLTVQPLYKYQGFWYTERHLLGVISSQKHFQAQDSDVFVITKPKCGTTWMKAITFALLTRKENPILSEDHPLLTRNPHDLVPFLEMNLYIDGKIPDIPSSPWRLLAAHMPYVALPESMKAGNSKCKVVYVARNPKDTLVSHWHFLTKLGYMDPTKSSIEDAFDYFCKGMTSYGPFWDHVLDYWKQSVENPQKVLFLRYEDMKDEPRVHLRRVAKFLNCPFSAKEEELGLVDQVLKLCSFDSLSSLEVNKTGITISGMRSSAVFRKGEVGDWKNYLTPQMAEKIDQITRHKFSGSGLVL